MESDFAIAPNQEKTTNTTRISVLYDVGSVFECALVATLKCNTCVAAVPREMSMDYAKLAETLTSCDPHFVVILGDKWDTAFYEMLVGKDRAEEIKRLVIVLVDKNQPERNNNSHIIFALPTQFITIIPTFPVISANLISVYLMYNQFSSAITQDENKLRDAAYFYTALRSQIDMPYEAYTLVKNIISDWKHVMDAEEMVAMGHYITHAGAKIATSRINKSVFINIGENKIRVIECPDYVAVTMKHATSDAIPTIIYTLSPNTTICALTCSTKEIAELATTNVASIAQVDDGSYFTATCATDDFFAIVRKNIMQPAPPPPLDPTLSEAVETGAKVLEFCSRAGGSDNSDAEHVTTDASN